MNKLPDAGAAGNRATDIRESLQQTDMVKKGIAEALGASRKIDEGILEDLLEIG